ncbi:MAG: SRPBCC domain-containing protein [Promethearchaeota archaeon]
MSEQDYDWTYFKKRIYIANTSKEELFQKWATSKGITEWFITEATYEYGDNRFRKPNEVIKAGDKYKWVFHVGTTVEGKILEVKENALIRFTFGNKEPDLNEKVIVTVTFHEKNGKNWIDILQENMAVSKYGKVYFYISCNMGWVFHLNNLKSIIETGHDLRVKGENRMHVDAPSGYPLENYNWTRFQQKEYVKASRGEVFKKWATPKGITEWYIARAIYEDTNGKIRAPNEIVKPGDKYTWVFYQGMIITGKVLDVVNNQLFKFTFGKKEPGSEEDVIVTVTLDDQKDYTLITLKQENITDNAYGHVRFNLSCMVGWSYFMINLRSIFESGYDLREQKEQIAKESRATTLPR